MSTHYLIREIGIFLGEPRQLFVGALHPHGLHPLFIFYEAGFRDLLSYCGEQGKILADALDVREAQRNDIGTFQSLYVFHAFLAPEEAMRRPAHFTLLYET